MAKRNSILSTIRENDDEEEEEKRRKKNTKQNRRANLYCAMYHQFMCTQVSQQQHALHVFEVTGVYV